jgi:hypothetical protein
MKFELKQKVVIECSGEAGEVIGRAEYSASSEPSYQLRYKCADGRARECWWTESALVAA